MTYERILAVLTEADPQGLIRLGAPHGEYDIEARMVSLRVTPEITDDALAKAIWDVFNIMFWNLNIGRPEDYREIANKIRACQ